MNALYQQLMEDHGNLSRVLSVLEQEVARYGNKDKCDDCRPDLPLIDDILDYVHYYPEAFHHPLEEAAFDYLSKHKALDDAVIKPIRKEHEQLEAATAHIRELINAIEMGQAVPMDKLQQSLNDYLDLQLHHIQHEEGEAFEAIKALDDKAAEKIMGNVKHKVDPLFAESSQQQFSELLQYIRQ